MRQPERRAWPPRWPVVGPVPVPDTPTPSPHQRIDAALARIEAAARRLSDRHAALRGEVERAVAELDRLMEGANG